MNGLPISFPSSLASSSYSLSYTCTNPCLHAHHTYIYIYGRMSPRLREPAVCALAHAKVHAHGRTCTHVLSAKYADVYTHVSAHGLVRARRPLLRAGRAVVDEILTSKNRKLYGGVVASMPSPPRLRIKAERERRT